MKRPRSLGWKSGVVLAVGGISVFALWLSEPEIGGKTYCTDGRVLTEADKVEQVRVAVMRYVDARYKVEPLLFALREKVESTFEFQKECVSRKNEDSCGMIFPNKDENVTWTYDPEGYLNVWIAYEKNRLEFVINKPGCSFKDYFAIPPYLLSRT